MRDEEQQRKERQAKLLSAIERKIAYKTLILSFSTRTIPRTSLQLT